MTDDYVEVAICYWQFQCDKCSNWFPVEDFLYEFAAAKAKIDGWKVVSNGNDWDIFCPLCAKEN